MLCLPSSLFSLLILIKLLHFYIQVKFFGTEMKKHRKKLTTYITTSQFVPSTAINLYFFLLNILFIILGAIFSLPRMKNLISSAIIETDKNPASYITVYDMLINFQYNLFFSFISLSHSLFHFVLTFFQQVLSLSYFLRRIKFFFKG